MLSSHVAGRTALDPSRKADLQGSAGTELFTTADPRFLRGAAAVTAGLLLAVFLWVFDTGRRRRARPRFGSGSGRRPRTRSRMSNSDARKRAEQLKAQGNQCFQKGKFAAAIEAYTEAITLCPNVPTYLTNRAICHRRRNEWDRVQADTERVLQLDPSSVKGHYMLGLALSHLNDFIRAAYDLARAPNSTAAPNTLEEIWEELSRVKHTQWQEAADMRTHKRQELRELLERLLVKEREEKLRAIELAHVVALDGADSRSAEEMDAEYRAKLRRQVDDAYRERQAQLQEMLKDATANDTPGQVPDYLCCKLTMDIYREPVITPSGITYEKAVLLEHLRKVGHFDPVSRAPLSAEQLVPNLGIRDAVQGYLEEHPWAYKSETY
eukprot:jgi/Chlat1/4982/Chrsp32S04966